MGTIKDVTHGCPMRKVNFSGLRTSDRCMDNGEGLSPDSIFGIRNGPAEKGANSGIQNPPPPSVAALLSDSLAEISTQ